MMVAETGVILNVVGRSKAIAAAGPRPGRTPTNVPMRTPKKQYIRWIGWSAT
jgi:hypothetical protein